MSLSFGAVVACNNIIALKSFTTLLSNYRVFDKPSFIAKWLSLKAQVWIDAQALKNFKDVKEEIAKDDVGYLSLNDIDTALFTVLRVAVEVNTKGIQIDTAHDLFSLISSSQLEFEKLKKPRVDESYK